MGTRGAFSAKLIDGRGGWRRRAWRRPARWRTACRPAHGAGRRPVSEAVDGGRWRAVSGAETGARRTAEGGVRCPGRRTVDGGRWTAEGGIWGGDRCTADGGGRYPGRRSVDGGRWYPARVRCPGFRGRQATGDFPVTLRYDEWLDRPAAGFRRVGARKELETAPCRFAIFRL